MNSAIGLRQILPWQIKSILVIVRTLRNIVSLSITHFRLQVERDIQMGGGRDLLRQLQFGPSKLPDSTDVPGFLLERQFRFQNNDVLRPADGHGLRHHLRVALIGAVEVPHPPQAPGREPSGVRVCAVQILRSGHSCALFRPAADQTANAAVQLHLRQGCRYQFDQRRKQSAVIGWLSNVHGISPFLSCAPLFCDRAKRNTGYSSHASLCFAYFCYVSCTICSHSRMCFGSISRLPW